MRYRHILTGQTVRVKDMSANRVIVVTENGDRMYFDRNDFATQYHAVQLAPLVGWEAKP